jgi:hypothetical protein
MSIAKQSNEAARILAAKGLKRCYICKKTLQQSIFCRDSTKWDGLTSRCNICNAAKKRPSHIKRQRKYEKAHPEKQSARVAVSRAMKSGALVKQPCQICGDKDAVAHHDDYTKPLDIRWLCQPHHIQVHYGKLPAAKRVFV